MSFEEANTTRYSKVTYADRFRVLHVFTLQLLDELERTFDVKRVEGYDLDPELEQLVQLARPTVVLVPWHRGAAHLGSFFDISASLYPFRPLVQGSLPHLWLRRLC